jgi:uncharacterized protein (DUF1501 family)
MSHFGCNHSRREFLAAGIAGTIGLALSPAWQKFLAKDAPSRRAKSCILLWLNGGPSHLDTFDPKPGADTGGPFQAINSAVPGMRFCEHLPKLAGQAKHLAVLRSLSSPEGDHEGGYHLLHTGNQRQETVEYPSLGSVMAREWTAEDGDLPAFVSLNGSAPGGGFFGVEFAPYIVGNLDAPVDNLALPEGVDEKRRDRRLKALREFNGGFARRVDAASAAAHERFITKALKLQNSPALKAFDLTQEKQAVLQAYGIPSAPPKEGEEAPAVPVFAKACLMARRLVENGVRFVEVTLDGWDTHSDNFNQVAGLCGQLDPAFAALIGDLSTRGMLDDTLVICLGEFGRTPKINDQTGRDHWSEAFSGVLAGGGIKGGQVIGATDDRGEHIKDRSIKVPDLYATLLSAMGVDPAKSYRTPEARPIKLAEKGQVVAGLLR